MSHPPFDYFGERDKLSGELDSAVAGAEWNSFLGKRKELIDLMMKSAMDVAKPVQPDPSQQPALVPVQPGTASRKPSQEQIGQAHFWGIANPETLDAQELQHQIEQRRLEVPAAQTSSLRSAAFATGATYAAAAGAAAKLTSQAFENVAGAIDNVPFIGPVLGGIMNNEMSKSFWQYLQQKSSEAVETARVEQPASDLGSFNFWTGAGKMAGYALPAVAAWEGLGALASGVPRLAWLGRVGTPLARAATKGALASAILTDPEAPMDEKVIDIGLGAFLGGAQMYGRFGAAVASGTLGASVGAQTGDTPGERARNAAIGGVVGASLPFATQALAGAFSKVKGAFKTPFDEAIANATHAAPGEAPAEWWFENDAPQVSGNPAPQRMLGPGGADGQGSAAPPGGMEVAPVSPTPVGSPGGAAAPLPAAMDAQQLHAEIASAGVNPPVTPEPTLGMPRVAGLLPSSTQESEAVGHLYNDAEHWQRILYDPEYRATNGAPAYENLNESAAFVFGSDRLNDVGLPLNSTVGDYVEHQLRQVNTAANVQRMMDAEIDARSTRGFSTVTNGPDHLLGSAVADNSGKPLRVYHGTGTDFEEFDPAKLDGEALFGPGLYHTESADIANGYSGIDDAQVQNRDRQIAMLRQELATNQQYLDNTDPQELDQRRLFNNTVTPREQMMTQQSQIQTELQALLSGDIGMFGNKSNVRPAFLEIKRPFDIDKLHSNDEVQDIIRRLKQVAPEIDWDGRPGDITPSAAFDQSYMEDTSGALKGEDLYYQLASADLNSPKAGPNQLVGGWADLGPGEETVGKAGLNNLLQQIGYDGITHIGGARTGNEPHRVWIAFDPRQVHPYFSPKSLGLEDAVKTAEGISKQATVMESQTLPEAIGKTEVNEADVVKAAISTNPGGVAVIKGISKPLDVMKQHPDVRFVETEHSVIDPDGTSRRVTRLDALAGDFTGQMIDQYQRWGTFEGNIVVTPGGIEGTVQSINSKGIAILKRNGGGPGLRVKAANLQPSRFSDPVHEAPQLWNQFKADLLRYMNEEAQAAQMAPIDSIWDPRVGGQMQQHLEDFLNRRGINDPATRHTIDADINQRWVDEARDLDPESRDMQLRNVVGAEDAASDRGLGDEPLPVSLEEKAESRGFIWLSNPQAEGGILRDTLNPEGALEVPIETDAAAEEFLKHVDRTAPDLTPASDVPADVAAWAPSDAGWEPRTGVEETADQLVEDSNHRDAELDRLEATAPAPSDARLAGYESVFGNGGGGAPPVGPPPPLSGHVGGFALPGGEPETLGRQFQRLYNEHPEKYAQLVRKWTGQHFRYTRYLMSSLENDLTKVGVDMGRAWQQTARLEDAASKAANEGFDWLREAADIVRDFPNELHRNGFVVRTHEVLNEQNRMTRWWSLQTKGYSDGAIKKMIAADDKLADFYHRLFMSGVESPEINFQPEREIERYISHVRQRQAQGMTSADAVYNSQGLLSPNTQFFAEFARDGNLQFRVMDTRALTDYYVRSMMFKKYQAPAYADLINTWQDGRIPEPIRNLLLDHASAMRFGYRPEPGMVTKAVRGLVENVLRVPMTNAEAARLTGMPISGMYQALLGGRTSIFFRDAIQPLMTMAKVRAPFLADSYKTVLQFWRKGEGAQDLADAYSLALKHGWVARDRAPLEALSNFEQQQGASAELLALSPQQAARREVLARVGDTLLPHWLQRGVEKVSTLRLYAREQRLNQFLSGWSGYKQAKASLGEYRRLETEAAVNGDASLAMSYDEFARKSFFGSFQQPIQRHLQELVESGQDEEAAATFAREVTKWGQQVYTTRERPAAMRGGFGRFAGFLMNFTGQFLEGAYTALSNGAPEHRARAMMVIGGVSAGMYEAGQRLGLPNLGRWAWTSSLHSFVNPVVERLAQAALAVGAAGAMADDRTPSNLEKTALTDMPGLLPNAMDYNPLAGYMQTAGAISEASQGTTPGRDIAALLVTGDRGSRIQYNRDAATRADSLYNQIKNSPVYNAPQQQAPVGRSPLMDFMRSVRGHPGAGGQQ